MNLDQEKMLHVLQVHEGFEIVLGWETRNKYRILNERNEPIGFAAEQKGGLMRTLLRQLRRFSAFKMVIFDNNKQVAFNLDFPFCWFFRTSHVTDHLGKRVGRLEQRFAIFRKKFELYGPEDRLLATIDSPLFKFWTFEVKSNRKLGTIQKKWSGGFSELFTDKDNFTVLFEDPGMSEKLKALMLSTCLMIDVIYFEDNQGAGGITDLFN